MSDADNSAGADMDGEAMDRDRDSGKESRERQEDFDAAFAAMISGMEQPFEADSELSEHTDAGAEVGSNTEGPNSAEAGLDESLDADLDFPTEETLTLSTRRSIAVYLTPLTEPHALQVLAELNDSHLEVARTEEGCCVVQELNLNEEEWEMALLVKSLGEFHPQIDADASRLSHMTGMPVVVFVALLGPGSDLEPGVNGQVLCGRWKDGAFERDLPAGMVMAQMPLDLEDLLLGRVNPEDVSASTPVQMISKWQALRMLGMSLRKPKGGQNS